jgi:hypothetical protein
VVAVARACASTALTLQNRRSGLGSRSPAFQTLDRLSHGEEVIFQDPESFVRGRVGSTSLVSSGVAETDLLRVWPRSHRMGIGRLTIPTIVVALGCVVGSALFSFAFALRASSCGNIRTICWASGIRHYYFLRLRHVGGGVKRCQLLGGASC